MKLQERIEAFAQLGQSLKEDIYKESADKIYEAEVRNTWFTKANIESALYAWEQQLTIETLSAWLDPYKLKETKTVKKVFIILGKE